MKTDKLTPLGISKTIQLVNWGEDDSVEEVKVSQDETKQFNKRLKFLEQYKDKLFNFEIDEIKELKQDFIYFAG